MLHSRIPSHTHNNIIFGTEYFVIFFPRKILQYSQIRKPKKSTTILLNNHEKLGFRIVHTRYTGHTPIESSGFRNILSHSIIKTVTKSHSHERLQFH